MTLTDNPFTTLPLEKLLKPVQPARRKSLLRGNNDALLLMRLRQEAPRAVRVESRRALRLAATIVGIFFVSSVIGGCAIVTVAGAAVSIGASAVSVAATAVETGVDVAAGTVKAVAGGGSASK